MSQRDRPGFAGSFCGGQYGHGVHSLDAHAREHMEPKKKEKEKEKERDERKRLKLLDMGSCVGSGYLRAELG